MAAVNRTVWAPRPTKSPVISRPQTLCPTGSARANGYRPVSAAVHARRVASSGICSRTIGLCFIATPPA